MISVIKVLTDFTCCLYFHSTCHPSAINRLPPTGISKQYGFYDFQVEMDVVYITHNVFFSKNHHYTFPFLQSSSQLPTKESPLFIYPFSWRPRISSSCSPGLWIHLRASLCLSHFNQSNLGSYQILYTISSMNRPANISSFSHHVLN